MHVEKTVLNWIPVYTSSAFLPCSDRIFPSTPQVGSLICQVHVVKAADCEQVRIPPVALQFLYSSTLVERAMQDVKIKQLGHYLPILAVCLALPTPSKYKFTVSKLLFA